MKIWFFLSDPSFQLSFDVLCVQIVSCFTFVRFCVKMVICFCEINPQSGSGLW